LPAVGSMGLRARLIFFAIEISSNSVSDKIRTSAKG
jgi:hypothetical protein